MTAPSSRLHADALYALLDADPVLTTYDHEVPDNPVTPYAVLYVRPGVAGSPNAALGSPDLTMPFQVTAVGTDRNEALGAIDRARAAYLEKTPVVAGRSCEPIWEEASLDVRRDETTRTADGRPLFYGAVLFGLLSHPA